MLIKNFGNSEWKKGSRGSGTNGVAVRNGISPIGPVVLLTNPWPESLYRSPSPDQRHSGARVAPVARPAIATWAATQQDGHCPP